MTVPGGEAGLSSLLDAARDCCEAIAVSLLGEPSAVGKHEMRWRSTYELVLSTAGIRRGLWYDFNSGEGGNILALIHYALGSSRELAIDWLCRELAVPTPANPHRHLRNEDDRGQLERILGACASYARGRHARGTLAERYFKQRGLDVPDALWEQLRFDSFCLLKEGRFPTVLAPMRDVRSQEIVGVHKIALNRDATNALRTDGRKLKKSAGQVKGAAMMLSPPGEELVVCEGLETAIGIAMGDLVPLRTPVWALSGASFLGTFGIVPGVSRLVIAADNDVSGVGLEAARRCARRWVQAGITVDIVWSAKIGSDFADVYRNEGLR